MTDTSADPRRTHERAAVECVARNAGSVSLHAMREAPDADLVHEQGFHIGVEGVRTVDQSSLEARRPMNELIEAVRGELESREVRGHFMIGFDIAEILSTPAAQRRHVPKQVAAFLEVREGSYFETAELKSHGVSCLAWLERLDAPETTKTFVNLGWRTQTLKGSLAETVLAKKDERLRNYRSENGDYFKEYWLAIASLGPGTIEDGGFSMLLGRNFVTTFDRVFLIMRGYDGTFAGAKDVTPVPA